MEQKYKKAVGKTGWLPFWFGNKFIKRLVQKRLRRKMKQEKSKEIKEEQIEA